MPQVTQPDCSIDAAMRVLRQFAPRGPCEDLRRLKESRLEPRAGTTTEPDGRFWLQLGVALGTARDPEELIERWLSGWHRRCRSDTELWLIIRHLDPHDALALLLVEACQLSAHCAAQLTNTSPRQFRRRLHRARLRVGIAHDSWRNRDR